MPLRATLVNANAASAPKTQTQGQVSTDGGDTLASDHVAVSSSTATAIVAASSTVRAVTIQNNSVVAIAIGDANVTFNGNSTDGPVLKATTGVNVGDGGSITLNTKAAVYGKAASSTGHVTVLTESD